RVTGRRVLVRLADLALELRIGLGELIGWGGFRRVALVLSTQRVGQPARSRQPAEQGADREHGRGGQDRSPSHGVVSFTGMLPRPTKGRDHLSVECVVYTI